MNTYEKQARDFLDKTNTSFDAEFKKHGKHFEGDKQERDVYTITLTRGKRTFSFDFGQSIANRGVKPTPYDVLACLQKYDVGSFEDFCAEYGYDADSRKAERIYEAVLNEFKNVQALWSDEEIELLQEIN